MLASFDAERERFDGMMNRSPTPIADTPTGRRAPAAKRAEAAARR